MPTEVKELAGFVLYHRLMNARRRALAQPQADLRLVRQQGHWLHLLEQSAAEHWLRCRREAGREGGYEPA